jgi:hypothetical protein
MKKLIAVAVVAALALVIPAGMAWAGNSDVTQQGSCDGNSEWKLKLSPENGQIEAEFEVDQNVSGDQWKVKIKHDGDVVFKDTRTTRGASGSFTARIVESNNGGTDAFKGRAKNQSTGEVCVGTASF